MIVMAFFPLMENIGLRDEINFLKITLYKDVYLPVFNYNHMPTYFLYSIN